MNKQKELENEIEKLEKATKKREEEMLNKDPKYIDDEKDYSGQYIYKDNKEIELLQAELKGIQSQKQKIIEVINNLPIDVIKDYKTKKVIILIDKKELLNSLGEK
jgi:hypothetical protein